MDSVYNNHAKEGLKQAHDEAKDFAGKFKAGYEAGYKKALQNWKNDKPLLREQVQGLADAAE